MAPDTASHRTGTASFKSIAQIYDSDDPSPEAHRDLSENAEDRIFHAILSAPGESGPGSATASQSGYRM